MEEERHIISLEDLENDFFQLGEDENMPGFGFGVCVTYLLVDCSGSMAGEDKLEKSKAGAIDFSHNAIQKGYSVGIIAFGSEARLISEAVSNISDLEGNIKRINIDGSTNMAAALVLAEEKLAKIDSPNAQRVIVLITDGIPDNVDATLRVAKECKAKGISIITLGTDDADKDFLKKIATDGSLTEIVSSSGLKQAIASAGNLLPSGK